MRKHLARCLPALLLACALPLAAQAATPAAASKQMQTAAAHAGMALGATDLKMAHAHLQHVVNCLVGPAGTGFDADAANPCKGMGQGAITDAKGDAATEAKLQQALDDAQAGLKSSSLDDAHAEARKAMDSLQAH